eukprot:TRINITY_DN7526_c0_g1_i4.p1 TRINITY_DN7526_c0_g1~~TRINITY_DN7526_c0_g1_i4.p1  ORF type:complete len:148 (+),score=54.64 TRINITY_DN7526_c0_g1_i4:55-498(+)
MEVTERKAQRQEARIAQLLVEVEDAKGRAQRAEGTCSGLQKALEDSHSRLLAERQARAAREEELQKRLDDNPAKRILEESVDTLRRQLDAKNDELHNLLASHGMLSAQHEAAALRAKLEERDDELHNTRLELMKYIRKCEALEADAE